MEKALAETASATRSDRDRPAPTNETAVSQGPENTQLGAHGPVNADRVDESDVQYVTGVKLATIISAVTLTAFLITLDTSIIATVNRTHCSAPPLMCILIFSKGNP